jgi:lysophospholipase L1-like esterase
MRKPAERRAPKCLSRPAAHTLFGLALCANAAIPALGAGLQEPEGPARFRFEDVPHGANPFHVPDLDLFWKLKPDYRAGPVSINGEGFRGPEFSPDKKPATRRIVLLGDSTTFGFKVTEESTYAHLLADYLGEDGAAPITVINAGVMGYSSFQGRKLYELRLRRYAPDEVVILFGYNDHHLASHSDLQRYRWRYLEALGNYLNQAAPRSLVERLRAQVAAAPLDEEPVPRVSLDEFGDNLLALHRMAREDHARVVFLTVPVRPILPLVENYQKVSFGVRGILRPLWIRPIDLAIRELHADAGRIVVDHFFRFADISPLARDPGLCERVQFLNDCYPEVALFPYLIAHCFQARGDQPRAQQALEEARRRDGERRQLEAYNERLRQLAADNGLEILDLGASFAAHADAHDLFLDVVHPSARGHALIASELAARLKGDPR